MNMDDLDIYGFMWLTHLDLENGMIYLNIEYVPINVVLASLYYCSEALTDWGQNETDAISQTTFSSAISWMKMYWFLFKFYWSLFPRVQLTIFQHWFRYLNQWWLVYWCIYAFIGLNELIEYCLRLFHWQSGNVIMAPMQDKLPYLVFMKCW